jgi:hypothetical protein
VNTNAKINQSGKLFQQDFKRTFWKWRFYLLGVVFVLLLAWLAWCGLVLRAFWMIFHPLIKLIIEALKLLEL